MTHPAPSDTEIAGILQNVSTIAVVGASNKEARPSYGVMRFLISKGYVVTPVNPGLEGQEILGCRVYGSLMDIPGPVDMVDIFRNSEAALEPVREAIHAKEKLGVKVVWLQLGVVNETAAREARAAGLTVVMDRCPVIEHRRLGALGLI